MSIPTRIWRKAERFALRHPLRALLLGAALVRLLAAWFSAGYAMHDDHFLVVEVAQGWADGRDIYQWVTSTWETNTSGRSLLYPGLVAGLFSTLQAMGCDDPMAKMLILRVIQALYSLLTVYYTYRIVRFHGSAAQALEAGAVVAFLWLMPFASVRTLAEVVSIPPLLAATWILLRYPSGVWRLLGAGLLVGVAFSLRYQTLLYGAGMGLALLGSRRTAEALWYALGTAVWIALVHGWVEWQVWGYPFGKIAYYVQYNAAHQHDYISHPWYNYLLVLPGMLFPLGLVFLWGAIRKGWQYPLLMAGFTAFFLFHSALANKQERFIFSVIPMFAALGVLGWHAWTGSVRYARLYRVCKRVFWTLNLPALLVFSTYYPKQSRTQALYNLRALGGATHLINADGRTDTPAPLPLFYLGGWPAVADFGKADPVPEADPRAEYALVVLNKQTGEAVGRLRTAYPDMVALDTSASNYVDQLLHRLNPLNRTEEIILYRLKPE
jgi:hypothetical protein